MPTTAFLFQRGVTWIGPAAAASHTWRDFTARMKETIAAAENGSTGSWPMFFDFHIPARLAELTVRITNITLYYYTATGSPDPYIDTVELVRSDLAGAAVVDVSFTTDLGNGSSGNASATIYSGSLALSDAPYYLLVTPANITSIGQIRIYGFRVAWEAS